MKKTNLKAKLLTLIFLVLGSVSELEAQSLTKGLDMVVTCRGYGTSPVAAVKRLGNQLSAPNGTHWVPPSISPAVTAWTADKLGQVFGVAIDDDGNVYLAASMIYNNTLASSNPGVFSGYSSTAGPGGIFKADRSNLNNVSVLCGSSSQSAGPVTASTKIPNGGYGIGNIAYAKGIDKLYATNFEDGTIYCINTVSGNVEHFMDPFGADASGAQIAPFGERVGAVAINYEASGTRLYFSLQTAARSNEIWSVKLNTDGSFDNISLSKEIDCPISYSDAFISDIAFSVRGEMMIAERGNYHKSAAYQYFGIHQAWSKSQFLPIGTIGSPVKGINSAGGLDYGYSYDAATKSYQCDSLIWISGDFIYLPAGNNYGMASQPLRGYTDFSLFYNESYVVRFDPTTEFGKGGLGDVESYDAECETSSPDICPEISLSAFKLGNPDECCYEIGFAQGYRTDYFSGVSIETKNLQIFSAGGNFNWGGISYQDPRKIVISDTTLGTNVPTGLNSFLMCFTGSGADSLTFKFIGNAPQYDTVCTKSVDITGCGVAIDTSCAGIANLEAVCDSGVSYMEFTIKNHANFTMRGLTIYSNNPDVTPVNKFIGIADLAPNATSPVIKVPLNVFNNAKQGCFYFAVCDQNTTPGTGGQYPRFCCMDSIEYCVDIPECGIDGEGGCNDQISMSHTGQDQSGNCCVNLTLDNRYTGGNIKYIVFRGVGGAQFSLFSGWSVIPAVSSNYIKVEAPGNGVSAGTYPGFANFCLTGTSVSPHMVVTDYLDANGDYLCTDTLTFPDCELVEPTCANIVSDSFYCENGRTKFTFSVQNNSPFDLYHIDLRTTDTSVKLDQKFIIPSTPIAPGSLDGPYTIELDSFDQNLDIFCLYLTGHNAVYNPDSGYAATQCCTDSLGVLCLPMIDCAGDNNDSTVFCDTTCCAFANITVPTGITPNNDGKNDVYVIQNSNKCKKIGITIYNRWGSLLYEQADYKNNWAGTNTNGDALPQGTYYVVVELEGGERKASYIDIRY